MTLNGHFALKSGLGSACQAGPSRGGEGESFSRPRDVWGARRRSKILKMVFQMAYFWPKICIKSIFGPLRELTTLPRTPSRIVRGHLSPRFLPLDAYRRLDLKTYRRVDWKCRTGKWRTREWRTGNCRTKYSCGKCRNNVGNKWQK